jgi:hypothetical protein
MTTIAWRDGVLCADKKASAGGTAYKTTKLFRTKTHALAVAGVLGVGIKFAEWWRSDRSEDCPLSTQEDDDNSTCILVMSLETGKAEFWEYPGVGIPVEDEFCAVGSGQDLAVGAMAFGATAIEAVECACEWDNSSGLGINYARSQPHLKKWGKKIKTGLVVK